MMRKTFLILLGAASGAALTLLATQPRLVHIGFGSSAKAAAADTYRQLNLFGDVFERVRADYVEKPEDTKLIESAIEVSLTRDVIRVRAVRSRPEDDVGYIRITQFNEQTTENLKKAITDLQNQIPAEKLKGFVVDLRNNPGGLLDQAISVSDAFLERGEIVSIRCRTAEETQRFNARAGDLTKSNPVIVLIKGGSASAYEIVAAAVQDVLRR